MNNISNFSLRQKASALVTAFVLMTTPIIAHAEKGDSDAQSSFKLVQQENKIVNANLTVVEFTALVERAYNYTKQFFNYPNMQQDIQNVCYLLNRKYMSKEEGTEEILIKMGYVIPVDMENGMFESIISAQCFNNERCDFNQDMIRETTDPTKLFNMANFCFDESDRELYNRMFNLWVNSHLNGTYDVRSMYYLFTTLVTLNRAEGYRNVDDMNAGAKFEGLFSYGLDSMQVLQDLMADLFTVEERSKYYDKQALVEKQWVRNDTPTEECASFDIPEEDLELVTNENGEYDSIKLMEYMIGKIREAKKSKVIDSRIEAYKTLVLSYLVDLHTQTRVFALEDSLNDLLRSFDKTCGKNTNEKVMVKSILPNMYQRSMLRG